MLFKDQLDRSKATCSFNNPTTSSGMFMAISAFSKLVNKIGLNYGIIRVKLGIGMSVLLSLCLTYET